MADQPRKITIKLRTPGAAKPPAAPQPAAPAAGAAVEPPPAPEASAPMTAVPPTAETPAQAESIRTEAPAETAAETPAQQAKRQTSRIELPPEAAPQPMHASATIKLKKAPEAGAAAEPPPVETTQAAKSKTARIALDSVLGGIQPNTPLANTTQKTIKLKRAVPAATAIKPAASAPMTPVEDSASEEKTIKLKRATPGLKRNAGAAAKPEEPELEELEPLEELPVSPIPAPAVESSGAKAFTVISIVAAALSIIATIVLCVVMQKQAASPNGAEATGNTLHSLPFTRF